MTHEDKIILLEKYINKLRGTINIYRVHYKSELSLPYLKLGDIDYESLQKRLEVTEDEEEIT